MHELFNKINLINQWTMLKGCISEQWGWAEMQVQEHILNKNVGYLIKCNFT